MSAKNTTIKRILKEAAELTSNPSPDFHAAPSDENLFEWHFTLRGPPAPSPFARGVYHGRILLPPAYPLRPPSFRFLTPSGRFEPNREICLSISGHHEETWQPAWGIRTALVALRSFMDTDAAGQVGGMSAAEGVRKDLAEKSRQWACAGCGKTGLAILDEQEERCKELGLEDTKEEQSELTGKIGLVEKKEGQETQPTTPNEQPPTSTPAPPTSNDALPAVPPTPPPPAPAARPAPPSQQQPTPTPTRPLAPAPAPQQQPPPPTMDAWIDKAIIGIIIALVFMILRRVA